MTKMRFFTVIGAATLLLGFGLNLQYALDDYGFTKNSLSGFILVQADSSAGQSYAGKQESSVGKCTVPYNISAVHVYYCGLPNANETCYNYIPCGALDGTSN